MIFRPGNLQGFAGIKPARQTRANLGGYSGLGAFGKGFIAPPPTPPPATNLTSVSGAVNAQTGQPYMQDPQCPEGLKMESGQRACKGDECCDIVGTMKDCDPEGTMYPYQGCVADPAFKKLLPPPPGGFPDCAIRKMAGYPDPCNEQTCPSCYAPQPQMQAMEQQAPQAAQQAAAPQMSAEEAARQEAESAKLQAELMKLEAEQAQVENIVTSAPTLPSPSSYTGSPAPVTTQRRAPAAPTSEQRLTALVQEYQTKKAMQRASAPAIRTVQAPPPTAMTPSAPRVSAPAPSAAPIAQQKPAGGIFSWLSRTLFGSPTTLNGYAFGQAEADTQTNILIPIAVVLGILFLMKRAR